MLHGTLTDKAAKTLKLVVDDNLSAATDVTLVSDGSWKAVLDISAFRLARAATTLRSTHRSVTRPVRTSRSMSTSRPKCCMPR